MCVCTPMMLKEDYGYIYKKAFLNFQLLILVFELQYAWE